MASVYLTDEEWQALFNEPPDLLKLYLSIKRVMDFKTGVAGESYRINDAFMREVLYVEAVQGRKAESYQRGAVRSKLQRLENLGLIQHIGKNVFKVCFYASPQSVRNNNSQTAARTTAEQQPEQQPIKPPAEVILLRHSKKAATINAAQQQPPKTTNNGPPLTSDIDDDNDQKRVAFTDYLSGFFDQRILLNGRFSINAWCRQGVTIEMLKDAVERSMSATGGKINSLKYIDNVLQTMGRQNEKTRSGKSGGHRHGEAGDYLQRQAEIADEYLRDNPDA